MSIKLTAKIKKHINTVAYYAANAKVEQAKVVEFAAENIDNTQVTAMVAETMLRVANGSLDAETAINDIQSIDLVQYPAPKPTVVKEAAEEAK
jgi:hypothetical protein